MEFWGMAAGVVMIGVLITIMLTGLPIAFALALVGIIAIVTFVPFKAGSVIAAMMWNTSNSFILSSLPLFIFMGEILVQSEVASVIYDAASRWVSRIPGGLLHTNILTCAIFAAVSGSSIATAATIGTVAVPEQERRGYDRRITLGSVCGGGTLGILIPPSIPLIIYGAWTGESVGQLFAAGIVPGLLSALLFMIYIFVRAKLVPGRIAPVERKERWRDTFLGSINLWPILLLMFIVLGSIFLGVATPTESAALGVIGAILIGLFYRRLNVRRFWQSISGCIRTSCMIMFIIMTAKLVAYAFAGLEVARELTAWMLSLNLPPITLMVAIYCLYLVLGCFLEGLSMMLLTLPLVFPMVLALGYSGVWFGIVMVILIEVGLLTPPVGLNLFVIKGLRPEYTWKDVVLGSFPFVLIHCGILALLTVWPGLAVWLPNLIYGRYIVK